MAGSPATLLPSLPFPRSRLIGRERERAEAQTLLRDAAVPLLTLTGPGGVGKTRLALAIAQDATAFFADSCVWVDLAPLRDASFVPAAIATALDLGQSRNETEVDALARHLRPRQILLLLDNCEHLVAAIADLVAKLLMTCPALQVLATSRAPFQIRGEQVLPIDPLPLPPPQAASPQALLANDAVRLFVAQACAVQPAFRLDEHTATTVTALCRRLDGLPLAIELAATRCKVLSPEALLGALSDGLRLLGDGPRDLPTRQQTMRDAIAWSYDLLSPADQALFRHLAVFAGGWTVPTAMAVCGGELPDVAAGLERLVDQSLIYRLEGSSAPRFTMLETIRAYGLERLAGSEEAAARQTHATYFRALAANAHAQLWTGRDQKSWLERLAVEHDNLRAALDWTLTKCDENGLGFAADLALFWWWRGHSHEAVTWLERALGSDAETPTFDRIRALGWRGVFVHWHGETELGLSLLEKSLQLARSLGDRDQEAEFLGFLGDLSLERGDVGQAERSFLASLALYEDLGDQLGIAWRWLRLALVADVRGDIAQEEALGNQALRFFRARNDPVGIAASQRRLGVAALHRGDLDAALAFLEEALAREEEVGVPGRLAAATELLSEVWRERGELEIARTLAERSRAIAKELGWPSDESWALHRLATIAADAGDLRTAEAECQQATTGLRAGGWWRELAAAMIGAGHLQLAQSHAADAGSCYREGLSLFQDIGDPLGQATALRAIACLVTQVGLPRAAVRLLAAATAQRERYGAGLVPSERQREEQIIVLARSALGEAGVTTSWEAGRALSWEEACREALTATTALPSAGSTAAARPRSPGRASNPFFSLTRREREILGYLCQRWTDPEIAEALFISPRTASNHVGNVLGKLGVSSRREAAALAVRFGLV